MPAPGPRRRRCGIERGDGQVWLGRALGVEVAEELDELGIELRARVPAQLVDRLVVGDRPLVRPVMDHRVVRVRDGHDAGAERDLVGTQADTGSRVRRSARGGAG